MDNWHRHLSFRLLLIFFLACVIVSGSFIRKLRGGNDGSNTETSYHGDDQMWQEHTNTEMDGNHGTQDAFDVSSDRGMRYYTHGTLSPSTATVASHVNDPSSQIFFHIEDLKAGTKLPLYFSIQPPSSVPRILPKKLADSIPFSSSQLPYLLHFFSLSKSSPQAEAMKQTLEHCELPPTKGETKFCATSLESMLDNTSSIFGPNHSSLKVLATRILTNLTTYVQNYTIMEVPKEILVTEMIGCHPLPYPYKVFYCHGQKGDNKVFRISLKGQYGNSIEAVGICHMDTSKWEYDHVAFKVLHIQPGEAPICHVFPPDNLVWIISSPTSTDVHSPLNSTKA